MFHQDTLIPTKDYGDIPIVQVIKHMAVPTRKGFQRIVGLNTSWHGGVLYFLELDGKDQIIFDFQQFFFKDGEPIAGSKLKVGDYVDAIPDIRKVTKAVKQTTGKINWYNIMPDTIYSSYYLANGLLVVGW